MRWPVALFAAAAALALAVPAAAELQPVRRDFGELQFPRLRAGTISMPTRPARVEVIVRLKQPPLAEHGGRVLHAAGGRRLSVRSASSRTYLTRLAVAQRTAVAQLRRAIPQARVGRRFRIVVNAVTVQLPPARLPALARLPFAARVYPSLPYTLALNASPDIIGASALGAAGTRGDGIKIAVVDDGIDPENPFFRGEGFNYPAGFPRGDRRFTTPKVIVARSYVSRHTDRRGRQAFDPLASFHGTHVAGIAAGNAGTTAPRGDDHPAVEGLSGVAPRAWIGNYRVFTVPTPVGRVANTPEIVAAFEAAVADGMHVINFSGGGPETDPINDIMLETIQNVAAAGVVPVIAAGNDREEFGLGTIGSPGTASEAITVAATSNVHVFGPALRVLTPGAPESLRRMPIRPATGGNRLRFPEPAQLVDVGAIVGTNGAPVDRYLCGPGDDPNEGPSTLPAGSLSGAIALVSRGFCTFASKAERARRAGAVGLVVVDNRPGEPNTIPIQLALPTGMIADLDGERLRAFLADKAGRGLVAVEQGAQRIDTGRAGIVADFSSGGPTAFEHRLKPDISAPGGQILSSTPPRFGGPFAVFDGTSMAAPHIAGAAALLLQRHPGWTPEQVKSALVTTAGAAFADTARANEAPVLLEGGGLANVPRADNPQLFTDPVSLSFPDVDVSRGARGATRFVRVSDAGAGGSWAVELHPQAATTGAMLELPPRVDLAPGGETDLVARAHGSADAQTGENYGFVVLRRGDVTRRIPYFFLVKRPALASVAAIPLRRNQFGSTLEGQSRVNQYRYPSAPFGPPPSFTGPPMEQTGAERLYMKRVDEPVVNFGAAVIDASEGAAPDPWLLGSKDENDVQGYAGTPLNVNAYTIDYRADVGAAGGVFPRAKTYYFSVDSDRDPFTGRSLAGRYLLHSWVNDVRPPSVRLLTARVPVGRSIIALRVLDDGLGRGSGVDPLSLTVGYRGVAVGPAAFDPYSGIAVFPIPEPAPALRRGRTRLTMLASDYQETKNVATPGGAVLPNTRVRRVRMRVVTGPTVAWLAPTAGACVARSNVRLLVLAQSTRRLRSVRFFHGERRIATVRRRAAGLFVATWRARQAKRGKHLLRAVVVDASGGRAAAPLRLRVCR